MAFQGAQGTDARYATFNEVHGDQVNITNMVSYSDGHPQYAAAARFDSTDRQPCLEGTREKILESVYDWIHTKDSDIPCIFWINGLAGTGKTTIAYTVAKNCEDGGILGASFFCSCDHVYSSNPKFVFTTIADQLGQFHSPFHEQLTRAHNADPGLKYSSVSTQLEKLLVKPLRAVRDTFPPCLVVLDALDECKDENAASLILSSLSRYIGLLTPLKFLVTSRPEPKIVGGFRLDSLRSTTQCLILHEVKLDVVEQDMEKYLKVRLYEVKGRYDLDDGWPSEGDVQALARLSAGLFIFAATAVIFIQDPNHCNPSDQLTHLFTSTIMQGSSPHRYLDNLYLQVLTDAFPDISDELSNRLKKILGTVALLHYPLFPRDIEHLLDLKPGTIRHSVIYLGSVLVVPKDDNLLIRLIHPSFFDFITNPTRCTNPYFAVDPPTLHALLAYACLKAMQKLNRDICQIRDPSKLDSEVEDLTERIAQYIPRHLQYACRSWTYHLSHCHMSDVPLALLQEFCSNSILYWVEVCSLLGELRSALVNLDDVCKVVSKIGDTDTLLLLDDCKRFIREFFPVLSVASSHTYHSALLFTPTEAVLRQRYVNELGCLVQLHGGVERKWALCLSTMEKHISNVRSIAVSRDGAHIASGSLSGTLCLWDFETGTHLQCFPTPIEKIFSVAFSPSGARVASGSGDNIVRLWDVASGVCVWELAGHTGGVASVLFSPDGTRIASGSQDGTIRIWDAATGIGLNKIECRWQFVRFSSVVFSPDGACVAAGSYERTIGIWDVATGVSLTTIGQYVMVPSVFSIVFSPDGTHLASGSVDGTVRLWDVSTGDYMKSVQAHHGTIRSISYSPDGTRIVSASSNHTINVWDTTNLLSRRFKGHTDQVTSISYSSDGTQIVSGSDDGTVRIWGAREFSTFDDSPGSGLGSYLKKDLNNCVIVLSASRIATWTRHGSTVSLWDVFGKPLFRLESPPVFQVLLSQSGAYLAILSKDKVFRCCSGLDGRQLQSPQGDWSTYSAAFSPDNAHVAFGCDDATVKVWRLDDDQNVRIFSGHSHIVYEVAFSPDGAYIVSLSTHSDPTIRVWSTETGTQVACFSHSDIYWGSGIHFSGDQRSIIATSRYGYGDRTWKLPTNLWAKDKLDPSFIVSEDGWLCSEWPRRRLIWIPARWRSNPKPWTENGCLLCLNDRTTMYIKHL